MTSMWLPGQGGMMKTEDYDAYAVPPGHPSRQQQSDYGFTEGVKSLGREFNPMKFEFAPMRHFNPLKFEFEVAETPETPDLMDMLPEMLGPERFVKHPQIGSMSHQDAASAHRLHSNAQMIDQPPPALDNETLSLLDTLELKFAPTFSNSTKPEVDVMNDVVNDVLMPLKPRMDNGTAPSPSVATEKLLNSAIILEKPASVPEEDHEGLTPEELRVKRNKAVQKRYRIRKKTQASRQQNLFASTKAELRLAESRAPVHHVAVVDKLMRLRRLDGERDEELKRLRKILANEKASDKVTSQRVMVMEGVDIKEGDYCDSNMEVILPRRVALEAVGEACCAKMSESLEFGDDAIHKAVVDRFRSSESPRMAL